METCLRAVAIRLAAMSLAPVVILPLMPSGQQAWAASTLESFARVDEACREWSDGCAVCRRQDDGAVGCSLPGIACQPAPVTCRSKPSAAPPPPRKAPSAL